MLKALDHTRTAKRVAAWQRGRLVQESQAHGALEGTGHKYLCVSEASRALQTSWSRKALSSTRSQKNLSTESPPRLPPPISSAHDARRAPWKRRLAAPAGGPSRATLLFFFLPPSGPTAGEAGILVIFSFGQRMASSAHRRNKSHAPASSLRYSCILHASLMISPKVSLLTSLPKSSTRTRGQVPTDRRRLDTQTDRLARRITGHSSYATEPNAAHTPK